MCHACMIQLVTAPSGLCCCLNAGVFHLLLMRAPAGTTVYVLLHGQGKRAAVKRTMVFTLLHGPTLVYTLLMALRHITRC